MKMFETDKNMLNAINSLKASNRIKFKKEAYDAMGITIAYVNNVKNQHRYNRATHFTAEHIRRLCTAFGVNANFIIGVDDEIFI